LKTSGIPLPRLFLSPWRGVLADSRSGRATGLS
jgi:hypothetical protein